MGEGVGTPVGNGPWPGKLSPAEVVDRERLTRLIRELDHDQFARRERARQELLRLEDVAGPALRAVLKQQPTLELRRSAEDLLEEIKAEQASPRRGAASRALAVLERIGSPEARRLLKQMAAGEPTAYLTRQAQQALERLNGRPTAP